MYKCLECLGLSLAEYARYSPLLFLPLCFLYTRLLQSDAGVQEQEIPDGDHRNVKIPGAFHYVEIPEDQEWFGGFQAGGLRLFDHH